MPYEISLKELISAGAHFGHQVKRWNPKIAPYLYGERGGVHIFDLVKTKELLQKALEYLKDVAKDKKVILFVGTKKQVKEKIKEVALATSSFYINERWLGGTLTNFDQIKKSSKKLKDLKSDLQSGKFNNRTKKERLKIQREIDRLERFFGGIEKMDELPDILVVVDINREKTSIKEARKMGVRIVAIVDSNTDPTLVDYPIPMNDDASKALEYVLELMKQAILEGKKAKETQGSKLEKVG